MPEPGEREKKKSNEVELPEPIPVRPPLWKYFTYPSDGTTKTLPIGRTKVDVFHGKVTLPDGTEELLLSSLQREGDVYARSLYIEVNNDAIMWLDMGSGGKTPIRANDFFASTYLNYREVWIETTVSTTLLAWMCTNPEAILRKTRVTGLTAAISGESIRVYGKYNLSGDWRAIAVDASGEIRVEATAEVSGQSVKVSGETVTAKVSGEVVKISGETVIAKISGEKVFPITLSGDYVSISGSVVAKTSGEVAKVSGEVVKVSGETIIAKISGAAIIVGRYLPSEASGAPVIASGDYGWVQVDQYGKLQGISVTANVSGQPVAISGEVVKISGETMIARVSGEAVMAGRNLPTPGLSGAPVIASGGVGWLLVDADGRATVRMSGEVVKVSGEVVKVSGEVVKVSGEVVKVSGEVVKISGETVIAKISGEKVFPITLSGDYIVISGLVLTSVSGNIVTGRVSGEVVKISGEAITMIAPTLLRHGYTRVGSISGGVTLSSGVVSLVKVRNLPGNADMWVGGGQTVNSGLGYLLQGGETDEFGINNLNAVYLYAVTSGQQVSWRAEG